MYIEWRLGWSRGKSWLSDRIAEMDCIKFEGETYPSRYSHVFWWFKINDGIPLVYESHIDHGVQITPWDHVLGSDKVICWHLSDPLSLQMDTSKTLWEECTKLHGDKYDTKHILGLLYWIKCCGRKATNRPWWLRYAMDKKYICSELVESTARKSGIDLNGMWSVPETSTPESIYCAHYGKPSMLSR